MGMGYGANTVDVISEDNLKKIGEHPETGSIAKTVFEATTIFDRRLPCPYLKERIGDTITHAITSREEKSRSAFIPQTSVRPS